MWMEDLANNTAEKEWVYSFRVWFVTRVKTPNNKDSQLMYSEYAKAKSDMIQCAQDLVAYWVQDTNYPTMDIEKTVNLETFVDTELDRITGCYVDIRFREVFKYDSCIIPMDGVPAPSDPCLPVTIYVNGTLFSTISSGGTDDIPVQNTLGTSVGTVTAGVKVEIADVSWTDSDGSAQSTVYGGSIVCSTAPAPDVYYNRPYLCQTVSYSTGDEAYRKINGANDYMDAVPTTATVQQVKIDAINGRIDYLKYLNIHGHRFQYTGINGGYYDQADGNYYDANGVLSSLAVEFPPFTGATYWIIDHLTGYMFPSTGFSNISYSNNLIAAAAAVLDGYSDFFALSRDEFYVFANAAFNNVTSAANRPPFAFVGTQWTCSPWMLLPSTNALAWTGGFGGSTSQQAYTYALFQEYYGRIHLTGTIPQ